MLARLVGPLAVLLALVLPLSLLLLLQGEAPWPPAKDPSGSERPRLVVLVVFDQMRGDYPQRWREIFGAGGLRRLEEDGAWFTNCHVAYAHSSTAPGHASLLTGCPPARHGIVENQWYDRASGAHVYCVASDRHRLVPPLPPDAPADTRAAASPERLLVPALGDVLKAATGGRAKVVALSLKDRSAVLPGGHRPDACYWLNGGTFVTSTYYRDRPHAWVAELNRARAADRWFGRDWTRLRPDLDYERWSGPDDGIGEWKGYGQGKTFPHPTTGGKEKIGKEYYQAMTTSPFGNELLLALAKRAIDAEQLGGDDVPDLLSVSFSSNDLIGHSWGPDSQEVLDITLRSDRTVKELLDHLDARVGKGRYALILTADHGICPLPELARKQGKDAGRILPAPLLQKAEEFLQQTFGGKKDGKASWIEAAVDFELYLNQRLLRERGLEPAKVEQALADWLARQEGIQTAYTRSQLLRGVPAEDALGQKVRRSFHPERSGDVVMVLKPFHLMTTRTEGTLHGTPHPYDTHVPFLVYGPGIEKGVRTEEIAPQAAAAIFAHWLGIRPPDGAETPVPEGLFRRAASGSGAARFGEHLLDPREDSDGGRQADGAGRQRDDLFDLRPRYALR
jgi:hypothetical protein